MAQRLMLILALLWLSTASVLAIQPDEVLQDHVLEARARSLSAGIRCLVCQGQSIDDSPAPLARDLRILVRERLTAGDSDRQVIDFLVGRYGEFVLLRPRLGLHTLVLWFGPFAILGLATAVVLRQRRSRTVDEGSEAPLSEDEVRQLDQLLRPGQRLEYRVASPTIAGTNNDERMGRLGSRRTGWSPPLSVLLSIVALLKYLFRGSRPAEGPK